MKEHIRKGSLVRDRVMDLVGYVESMGIDNKFCQVRWIANSGDFFYTHSPIENVEHYHDFDLFI
jgi:hypothetical protein